MAVPAANGATVTATRVTLCAVPLIALAASIHYADEYADHETDRTPFSDGSGAPPGTAVPRQFVLGLALAAAQCAARARVAGGETGRNQ